MHTQQEQDDSQLQPLMAKGEAALPAPAWKAFLLPTQGSCCGRAARCLLIASGGFSLMPLLVITSLVEPTLLIQLETWGLMPATSSAQHQQVSQGDKFPSPPAVLFYKAFDSKFNQSGYYKPIAVRRWRVKEVETPQAPQSPSHRRNETLQEDISNTTATKDAAIRNVFQPCPLAELPSSMTCRHPSRSLAPPGWWAACPHLWQENMSILPSHANAGLSAAQDGTSKTGESITTPVHQV